MTATAGNEGNGVDLSEAARQLQQAAHDVRVAFDCIGLDELDRAHTHAITARAAVDAAENLLRVALGGSFSSPDGEAESDWSIAGR
ncbi:MAG TPA: hypothetical protein VF843_07120 [Streptosporangiaceae bacterium]